VIAQNLPAIDQNHCHDLLAGNGSLMLLARSLRTAAEPPAFKLTTVRTKKMVLEIATANLKGFEEMRECDSEF
jgi:hypothetical protein